MKGVHYAFVVNHGQGQQVQGRGDQRRHSQYLQDERDARHAYFDAEHHGQEGIEHKTHAIESRGQSIGDRQVERQHQDGRPIASGVARDVAHSHQDAVENDAEQATHQQDGHKHFVQNYS